MALLVIGVGNGLRGDDGAGRTVADRIDALALPGVTVRSVTQLVPELAIDLAAADRVVFVDADVTVSSLTICPVVGPGSESGPDSGGGGRGGVLSHHLTPGSLVGLAHSAGGRAPAVVEQCSIPATDFDIGAGLSATTQATVDAAVALLVERASSPA